MQEGAGMLSSEQRGSTEKGGIHVLQMAIEKKETKQKRSKRKLPKGKKGHKKRLSVVKASIVTNTKENGNLGTRKVGKKRG